MKEAEPERGAPAPVFQSTADMGNNQLVKDHYTPGSGKY